MMIEKDPFHHIPIFLLDLILSFLKRGYFIFWDGEDPLGSFFEWADLSPTILMLMFLNKQRFFTTHSLYYCRHQPSFFYQNIFWGIIPYNTKNHIKIIPKSWIKSSKIKKSDILPYYVNKLFLSYLQTLMINLLNKLIKILFTNRTFLQP